jgi:hypothetical protein
VVLLPHQEKEVTDAECELLLAVSLNVELAKHQVSASGAMVTNADFAEKQKTPAEKDAVTLKNIKVEAWVAENKFLNYLGI